MHDTWLKAPTMQCMLGGVLNDSEVRVALTRLGALGESHSSFFVVAEDLYMLLAAARFMFARCS